MTPDGVTDANVVFVVSEHQRRLGVLEGRTEDLNVVKRDLVILDEKVNELTERVAGLQRALYTAAVSVAASSILFAVSIFLAR